MNVLITGIHGFVGRHLAASLSSHHTVVGVGRTTNPVPDVERIYTYDDLDCADFPQPDAVIHLAAIAHDTDSGISEQEYDTVNFGLSRRLYDRFLTWCTPTFIFFSSVKAATDSPGGEPLTEDVQCCPITAYGRSKLRAEQYILSRLPDNGRRSLVLRPAVIFGQETKGNMQLLERFVRSGMPWPLGAFDAERSLLSIETMQDLMSRILESDIPSGVYNLADEQPMTVNGLVKVLGERAGRNVAIWRVPKWLVKMSARCGDVLHLPLTSARLAKLTEPFVVSSEKLRQALDIAK